MKNFLVVLLVIVLAALGCDDGSSSSSTNSKTSNTSLGSELTATNGTFNGTYSILAVHSGKALDCWEWGTGDGTNIAQYDYWGGGTQQFNIKPVDGIWHRITPVIAAGQSFDVSDCSTNAGANIQTWTYWGGECQLFRFENAGTSKWRIIGRTSEMCLDIVDASTGNGANVIQNDCLSDAENQIFELVKPTSGDKTQADNPLFKNFRSADASPLVHNGRFYIVCGEDEVDTNAFDMYSWRLISSEDMIHWTDHGVILKPGDISWMPENQAWASCIVYRNGYFYFYASNAWQIGVLRSTSITGPYEDILGEPLIDQDTPNNTPDPDARDIDPMCFIDDDGQAYLFWGGDGICRYAKLGSDMISLASSVMDVPGLTGSGYTYLEAPFVIKENGTYFLMYADRPWPSEIRYATASSISGPWTHQGVIGTATGTGTNHEGAAYFNGQWWYTYHTEELSNGNPYSRSVCVDPMTINGNTIKQIQYSSFD